MTSETLLPGLYQALVISSNDPLQLSRVQVKVPSGDIDGYWARACIPTGWNGKLPTEGSIVWIAFECGDPSRPVWMGVCPERS